MAYHQIQYPDLATPISLYLLNPCPISDVFLKSYNILASSTFCASELHKFTALWVKKCLLTSVLKGLPLILKLWPLVLDSPTLGTFFLTPLCLTLLDFYKSIWDALSLFLTPVNIIRSDWVCPHLTDLPSKKISFANRRCTPYVGCKTSFLR